jgi:hypothetical protein
MKLTDKEKVVLYDKRFEKQRRANVKDRLLKQKAIAAGITVSPAEVDEYIKKHFK